MKTQQPTLPTKQKGEPKTASVHVGVDRYTEISKAALNVSNAIGTGRIVTAGEMAQFLVDNFLDKAWAEYARVLSAELAKLP